MKKIIVLMLSCCSLMTWAQTDKELRNDKTVKKSAQTDQSSLDGRSFRITIKAKAADAATSQYQQNGVPGNQTGVNAGNIDNRSDAERAAAGHTDVKKPGSQVITDPNSVQDKTDVQVAGTMDTTTPGSPTTMDDGTTGNTNMQNNNSGVAYSGSAMEDLDGKTLTVSFSDGVLSASKKTSDKNSKTIADNTEMTAMDNEMFTGCSYQITSGSGTMSTFSSSCTGDDAKGGRAYWNGYINEGTITGNLIVYKQGGGSDRYTFTGKATRSDVNRKATSLK